MNIFVSYSRNDIDFASELVNFLRSKSFSVKWDQDLQVGQTWPNEIENALNQVSLMIVCWSESSVRSNHVVAEALKGFERGVLFPISLDVNATPPYPFNALQKIDVLEWNDTKKDLLLESLNKRLKISKNEIANNISYGSWTNSLQFTRNEIINAYQPIVKSLIECANQYKLDAIAHDFAKTISSFGKDKFQVAVVGSFKNGKTTLINSLIISDHSDRVEKYEPPLPMHNLKSTAVPTTIGYGFPPTIQAVDWDDQLNMWSFQKLKEEGQLWQKNISSIEKIAEFRVSWPSRVLKGGLEIVDTPGSGDDYRRTIKAKYALASADAVIIVYRNDRLGSEEDASWIEEVKRKARKVFHVINLREPDKIDDDTQNFVQDYIARVSSVNLEMQDIFFVNCKNAYDGRINADKDKVEASGIVLLESNLIQYAKSNKVFQELSYLSHDINLILSGLKEKLHHFKKSTLIEQKEFYARLEEAGHYLKQIVQHKNRVTKLIDDARIVCEEISVLSFNENFNNLAESINNEFLAKKLPAFGNSKGIFHRVSAAFDQKVITETKRILQMHISEAIYEWAENENLSNGLISKLKPYIHKLEADLKLEEHEIRILLRKIGNSIQGEPSDSNQVFVDIQESSFIPFENLATGSEIDFAKSLQIVSGGLATSIGTVVAVGVTAVFLNVALVPAIIATILAGVVATIFSESLIDIEKSFKVRVLKSLAPEIEKLRYDIALVDQIKNSVKTKFVAYEKLVSSVMQRLVTTEQESLKKIKELRESAVTKEELFKEVERFEENIESASHANNELLSLYTSKLRKLTST
jgi:GTPase SAR1 family protein